MKPRALGQPRYAYPAHTQTVVNTLMDACTIAGDRAPRGSHRRRACFRCAAALGAIARGEAEPASIESTLAEARALTGALL